MTIHLAPLLVAAAVVGIIHMSAPDHWVTLCMLGRTVRWTNRKLFGISLFTALGHVILSVLLGLAVVIVGIVFSKLISVYLSVGIGAVMLVVGLIVGIRPFLKKEEDNPERQCEKEEQRLLQAEKTNDKSGLRGIGYFAVLGAALSPDLSIVPVFLVAIPAGFLAAVNLAIVFGIASIVTLVLLVQVGSMGLEKAFERFPEKYNESLVGFVIAGIGIYIMIVQ